MRIYYTLFDEVRDLINQLAKKFVGRTDNYNFAYMIMNYFQCITYDCTYNYVACASGSAFHARVLK